MNVLNAATQHQYCILVVDLEIIMRSIFVRLVKQYRVLWLQQRIVCLEFDEESELDNVNLVTVYGEDYNNKELVEYSKREKAKKCNHYSSQVISEIPYQIEIDFQNLTDIDKRLPHMKYYLTFKDIVKMVRKGKKRIIHCNDCHYDVKYNSFMDDFNIKCIHCGNNQLEVWDEKHCPKCGEEMVWGGDWGRNFLIAEWD